MHLLLFFKRMKITVIYIETGTHVSTYKPTHTTIWPNNQPYSPRLIGVEKEIQRLPYRKPQTESVN